MVPARPNPYRRRIQQLARVGAYATPLLSSAGTLLKYGNAANQMYRGYKSMYPSAAPIQRVQVVKQKQIKRPRKKQTLKNQVKEIAKKVNNMTSTLTYRYVDCTQAYTVANQAAYLNLVHSDSSFIELALAQTRFFDPSNPGTLIQGSGATGTYDRTYSIKNSSMMVFRNNYQVPAEIRVYKYKCKTDTSIEAITAFTNGLADIGNPSAGSIVVYPSDVSQLRDLYTLKSTSIWKMKPGDERTFSINSKAFNYDPAEQDSQTQPYQKDFDTHFVLIRVQGPPSHDKTTPTQNGTIGAGVDILWKRVCTVKYNSGGPNLEFLVINDQLDTQTAGPVVSQIVVDNQEYSTA